VIPLAHIAGLPVEELLPMIAGPGGGLLAVRAWITMKTRRREESGR
jgi:hypothetical protein